MNNYPINLDSSFIRALVIGAGNVGLRKIETLLKQGVKNIHVVDISLSKKEFKFADISFITYEQRAYTLQDLEKANLVFVATSNADLNSRIAQECKERNILCNVATLPNEGSFSLPALIQKDDVLLTLSTNGLSPALSRALKEDIEIFLDKGYCGLCSFLGRLRPKILMLDLPTKENTQIFRFFVTAPYKEIFLDYFHTKNENQKTEIEKILKENFSAKIQVIIEEELC